MSFFFREPTRRRIWQEKTGGKRLQGKRSEQVARVCLWRRGRFGDCGEDVYLLSCYFDSYLIHNEHGGNCVLQFETLLAVRETHHTHTHIAAGRTSAAGELNSKESLIAKKV